MRFVFKGLAPLLAIACGGCGLTTPIKNLSHDEQPIANGQGYYMQSAESHYENQIVDHVQCEIATALAFSYSQMQLPWLKDWGTAVTLTITTEDQGGVSPGVSIINPLQNWTHAFPVGGTVISPQSFATNIGASAAANATRTETIKFTYVNSDLLDLAPTECSKYQKSTQIDGDLKIREFIFDKASIARLNNGTGAKGRQTFKWPLFNTMTEEINFVAAFGGNVTPTWKLARVSANSTGNLLSAERTYTNDLVITIGPIRTYPSATKAAALGDEAQAQHNAQVVGNAIATSIQGQMQSH